MECRIEAGEDCTVIAPVGRIDSATVATFMEKVLDCVRNGKLPVALDMRDVPFMNSAGLRVLMIAQRDLDRRGQRLSVRSAQPAVDTLLRVAGLDTLMEVRP
jgi:anti-anti-sigma factor